MPRRQVVIDRSSIIGIIVMLRCLLEMKFYLLLLVLTITGICFYFLLKLKEVSGSIPVSSKLSF